MFFVILGSRFNEFIEERMTETRRGSKFRMELNADEEGMIGEMLINYFMILLISLHRIALQKPRKKNLQNMNDMEQAAQYFRMHYNKPISIEDYAVSHNMSISWFIQNFRQYANTTPAQYVQSLRLTNAKMLLETTNYNITEIANLVGYENPLYFSRFFRKQCGMSPSQFRKQLVLNAENCPK